MAAEPIVLFWSGGKDSAMALHQLSADPSFEVKALVTTINPNYQRISMHGVPVASLENQAQCIGLPLIKMEVGESSNTAYEQKLEDVYQTIKTKGIHHIAYGDIFLEDLRDYRDQMLAKCGLKGIYPLWKKNTAQLIKLFLEKKFRTITCCINDGYLDESWLGQEIDQEFLRKLPSPVDPCGENGEFHTFCFDGPIFRQPMKITTGEKVYRKLEIKTTDTQHPPTRTKGFWYIDIIADRG